MADRANVIRLQGSATGIGVITQSANDPVLLPDTPSKFSLQVNAVGGTLTSWSVLLEGSLDGVNWTTIITHSANAGSFVSSQGNFYPCDYVRIRVASLSLGTATAIACFATGAR